MIGARNLSNSSSRSRRSTAKLTHKDKGIVLWHKGGMNRARASRQNELSTKMPSHHCRHRSRVRRSMPSASRSNYPLGLQAVDHGRNQHHHQPGINAPAQKAHRRRSVAPSAAFLGATQAKPQVPLRPAPRLAVVVAAVQLAAAQRAALRPGSSVRSVSTFSSSWNSS